jgi:glucuronate isomerase
MKPFLNEDFLLQTPTAQRLYHEYAKDMPIIDYHNHLPPQQIAEDRTFENLTQIWLKGDHYKWRAMRANGVDEQFITGNTDDETKFMHWAATVPYTLRNPLYHWTHLELKNPFGITQVLDKTSAKEIYKTCNEKLKHLSTMTLLNHFKVEVLCTTDDPADDLTYHTLLQNAKETEIAMFPTFRPDKAMSPENIENYNAYLDTLATVSGVEIVSWNTFLEVIGRRHDFFATKGCRLSDHGLENFYAENYTETEIKNIFHRIRNHQLVNPTEISKFKSACLYEFAKLDAEKGWTQQFHIGALRNTNSRLLHQLGADAGVDSIGDFSVAQNMAKFFDRLDKENKLAKTIIYNLNPADNEVFATMTGNFQDSSLPGKIQFGSGWWFLDQKDGMERQINTLANIGLLSRFVGMLTDSRSFLSFSRHEYFRRILCNIFGNDIENGELPNDLNWTGKIIQDICYHNAKNYFNFQHEISPQMPFPSFSLPMNP